MKGAKAGGKGIFSAIHSLIAKDSRIRHRGINRTQLVHQRTLEPLRTGEEKTHQILPGATEKGYRNGGQK